MAKGAAMRVLLTGVLVGLQLTTCAVTAFLPIPRMLLVESPWGLAGVDRSLNSWDVITSPSPHLSPTLRWTIRILYGHLRPRPTR